MHKRGFRLKKDAQEFEREFLRKNARLPNMAFASLVELYNADMLPRLKAKTRQTKKWVLDTHILPYFSELPLDEITPVHIRKWQSDIMTSKDYAPTYLRKINNELNAIFNYAVRFYKLPSNPCHEAGSMGKKTAGEMKFWTLDEFERFVACVSHITARTGFLLLYWTGMRIGELLALTGADFDYVKGTVTIDKSFDVVEGEAEIDDPKTEKSSRTIQVPAAVLQAVREYIPRLYDYQPGDRLFAYTRSYFYKERDAACEASGVKTIRLHDIRHSHAALLIDMGVPILLISERLGHADVETTLRDYGHLYPNKHDDTVARLDELMKPKAPPEGGADD